MFSCSDMSSHEWSCFYTRATRIFEKFYPRDVSRLVELHGTCFVRITREFVTAGR